MFISMTHSVHLDLIGLPDGWLVVEEPLGNDSGNPGIKYRNYWTDDVTRMKTPPTAPAPPAPSSSRLHASLVVHCLATSKD